MTTEKPTSAQQLKSYLDKEELIYQQPEPHMFLVGFQSDDGVGIRLQIGCHDQDAVPYVNFSSRGVFFLDDLPEHAELAQIHALLLGFNAHHFFGSVYIAPEGEVVLDYSLLLNDQGLAESQYIDIIEALLRATDNLRADLAQLLDLDSPELPAYVTWH